MLIDLPCRYLVENMGLEWRGVEGEWCDTNGRLVAFDPSVRIQGPSVLLFRRDALIEFLDSKGLTVFWTLLGRNVRSAAEISCETYEGNLEINGACLLKNGTVVESTRPRFVARGAERGQKEQRSVER